MLVYAPGWSLSSQFWSYTTPKKLLFFCAKKRQFQRIDINMRTFAKKVSDQFFLLLLRLFLPEILSHRSRLSWTTSDSAQKRGKLKAKIAFFLFLRQNFWHDSVTSFSTFANIKGSLPTDSTRPVDCDRSLEQTVTFFPAVFGDFFFRTS